MSTIITMYWIGLSVILPLRANGNNIQGESSQSSLGRENSIECLSYHSDI